jgi:hypothetical protein
MDLAESLRGQLAYFWIMKNGTLDYMDARSR